MTNKANDDGTVGAPALYANIPIVTIKNEARKVNAEEQKSETSKEEKVESKEKQDKDSKKKENNLEEKKVEEKDIKEEKKISDFAEKNQTNIETFYNYIKEIYTTGENN